MCSSDRSSLDDPQELRRLAEEQAARRQIFDKPPESEDLPRLVHELGVHQIELEMQNDALRGAQNDLEASRDRYAMLYNSAPIGYLTLDEQGTIEECNAAALRMLGNANKEIRGRHLVNYAAAYDKNRLVAWLQRCRSVMNDHELTLQINLKGPGPDEIPVQVDMTPTIDPQSGRRQYLTALTDLSQVRRSEKAAQEADRRLAELLESISDAFVSLDRQWRFTYANDHACGLLQKPRSELVGSILWEAFPEARTTPAESALRRAMQDRSSAEFEINWEDRNRYFSVRCYPTVTGITVYFLDITQQKRDTQRLADSERRLRLALEAGEMGSWSWHIQDQQAEWSDRMFQLLGLAPRDGPVDPALFFERVHPNDRVELNAQLEKSMARGSTFHHIFRVVWDNGSIHWLRALARLTRDSDGRPLAMTGVNFDITQSVLHRNELLDAKRNLAHEVTERTSELQMLRDIAAMANHSQSVEEALDFALRRVTEHNGWSFAHSFLPSDDRPDILLAAYDFYPIDDGPLEAFRRLTRETTFRRGNGLPGRVYETGRAEWTSDLHVDLGPQRAACAEGLGIATVAAFPIMAEDKAVGVFEFFSHRPVEPNQRMLEAMASVGTLLGRVIERKVFQSRLLTIADDEQRRLGQQLHDDIGQELTGLALKAETLTENLTDDGSRWSEFAAQLVQGLNRLQHKTRALSHGLIPMDIEAAILEAALEDLAEQATVPGTIACSFHCDGESRVSNSRAATQLFRIAQEAVANALAHAEASTIEIELSSRDNELLLTVRDDGKGLPSAPVSSDGMGLRIMRQRAALIDASLTILPYPSGGTEIVCRVRKARF